jgi:hypothetical protein
MQTISNHFNMKIELPFCNSESLHCFMIIRRNFHVNQFY